MDYLLNVPFTAFSHYQEMRELGIMTTPEEVELLLDDLVEQERLTSREVKGVKVYRLDLDSP